MDIQKVAPSLRLVRAASAVSALAVVATALLSASPARAIDPGVVYEPGSPAGKEYAIPLEEARREAGSAGARPKGTAYAPFGVGITPPGGGAPPGGGSRGGAVVTPGEPNGDVVRAGGGESGGHSSSGVLAQRLAAVEREGDDGSATRWTIGVLVAILLSAGVVGLLVARRQGGPKAA